MRFDLPTNIVKEDKKIEERMPKINENGSSRIPFEISEGSLLLKEGKEKKGGKGGKAGRRTQRIERAK